VEGLKLMLGGTAVPESTVVAFASEVGGLGLFVLADELTPAGWHTQPQLSYAGLPRSIRLTVTAAVAPRASEFAPALTQAAAAAREAGPVRLPPDLFGILATLDPADVTAETVASLADLLGLAVDGRGRTERRRYRTARRRSTRCWRPRRPRCVRRCSPRS
jgi:hypothetical protein